jgi:GT2 family glycosyltransferase
MTVERLVALLTCHNRVERTVNCLDSLFSQEQTGGLSIEAVLVDAGSTDGTPDAVAERFPQVTVLRRGDDLFWNGGMRVAFAHAHADDPDHYLWLNDDVELDPDAIARLYAAHGELTDRRPAAAIVVGNTRDPQTGQHTYGGLVRPDRLRRMRYSLVEPTAELQQVETMNGNCVLIPRAVAARTGNLAAAYTHGMGDYDYGHRATRAGFESLDHAGDDRHLCSQPDAEPAADAGRAAAPNDQCEGRPAAG